MRGGLLLSAVAVLGLLAGCGVDPFSLDDYAYKCDATHFCPVGWCCDGDGTCKAPGAGCSGGGGGTEGEGEGEGEGGQEGEGEGGQEGEGEGPPPCVPTEPPDEVCDQVDNNCDGETDEGFDAGDDCTSGVGACATAGIKRCVAPDATECDAVPGEPEGEVCNGEDDDCDGATDEDGDGNPLTLECYGGPVGTAGVGLCRSGRRLCDGGEFGERCNGEIGPTEEAGPPQGGRDEDCDGLVDEGFSSLSFDGAQGSRAVLGDADLTLSDVALTIEAWIRPSQFEPVAGHAAVSRRTRAAGAVQGYFLGLTGAVETAGRAAQRAIFLVGDLPESGFEGAAVVGDHVPLVLDEWHHIAAVWDSSVDEGGRFARVALFLDGALVGLDEAFVGDPMAGPARPTWVGADKIDDTFGFYGRVGDVRLTVAARYPVGDGCADVGDTCFDPPPCLPSDEPTAGLWRFDEGSGATSAASGSGGPADVLGDMAGRWVQSGHCSEDRP